MRILPPIIVQESRAEHSFAHYSHRAVRNIYEASLDKRERLTMHHAKLTYWVETEYDIFRLLPLADRMHRVETNLSQLDEKIRALETELIKRRLRELG